jgi:hypothetical protein
MNTIFERIYERNVWGNPESRSGDGSDERGTEQVRKGLASLLEQLAIKSMVDVPAGDFNWMRLVDLSGISYLGGDIVPGLIESNEEKYGGTNIQFRLLDARVDPIPKVDLILCRDMLVHFSYSDCQLALANFRRSGSAFLLTTTFTARDPNRNIETGQWRPLNLQRPPFSFPRPSKLIVECCSEWNGYWADKCLALWRLDDLNSPLEKSLSSANADFAYE